MGNPVVHFEVHSQESEELRRFYSELFGWKLGVVPDGSYALVDTDAEGAGIRGGIAQSSGDVNGVIFYIQVPDIEAHLERIRAAGGSVLVERTESPQVSTAIFADPDGNPVGLAERP
ncbi:MAG: VOC family protein [Actinomycetota bacterium]|nr:VOC family protein [Actinomycetota bacterium]